MSVLKIVKYPASILKQRVSPVKNFNSELKNIVRDMFETMYAYNGIGLAANQVGIELAIVVVDISKVEKNLMPLVLINPKILSYSRQKEMEEEGCLSFPGYYEKILRSKTVVVSYYDINGNKKEIRAEGLFARVLQHEIDHINGITFIKRLPLNKRIRFHILHNLGKYKF